MPSSSSLSSPSPSSLKPPNFLSSDFDASCTCTNNNNNSHHDSPTATRRKIDMMDSKIVKACNDLIQEQTNSARLRAEQQTEYRIALQKYKQIHQRWLESYKVPSGTNNSNIMMTKNTSSSSLLGGDTFAIHQEAVAAAFEEEEHDKSTESKKNNSMSPYLLTRLSNLCYHVHLMTLLETYAKTKIHEEYRVNIIWWIHEYWEQLEKETTKLNLQKEQAMADLNGIQHQHKTKLLLLDQEYQQNKKDLTEKAMPQARGGELEEEKNSQIVEAGG